jgi:hypothetical protein
MQDLGAQIAAEFAKSPVVAAWFTAGGAIFAATISALVSYLVAHRSVYINAVTAERSKWIEAMRATISSYSGLAGKMSARQNQDPKYQKGAEFAADGELLQKLLSDLTLRLNPTEQEARDLLRVAKKLDQTVRLHRPVDYTLVNEIMIRHAQWVTKAEWEQVKREASGVLARPYFSYRKWRRDRDYAAFLGSDGSLDRLDLVGSAQPEGVVALARSAMDAPPVRGTPLLSWSMRKSLYKSRWRKLVARLQDRKPRSERAPGHPER